MSLSSAIGTALRGINVSQDQINNSSNNIANANTPGYIKQTLQQQSVVTAGVGQGAEVTSIIADINLKLAAELRNQSGVLSETNALQDYYDFIQLSYGSPGEDNALNIQINNFFSSVQVLSDDPGTSSLRQNAVAEAVSLADKFADIATTLEDLRYQADQEIGSTITTVNNLIDQLADTNEQITGFEKGESGYANIENKRNELLRQLSEHVDISFNVNNAGKLSILAGNGITLLDESAYHLDYSVAGSAQAFINNTALDSIEVFPVDENGNFTSATGQVLVSGGVDSDITRNINQGTLNGLLDVRDDIIPGLLTQLDNLAGTFREEANRIHNNGASYPPPSSLTGETGFTQSQEFGFSGNVRIAVVNSDGTAVSSPFNNQTGYPPLNLDLGSLEGTTGIPGQFTAQDVVDEINSYFGPPQNKANVGNLQDISLVAVSDSVADGGATGVEFDLQLSNTSQLDSTMVIQSVTVIDPIDLSAGYTPATLPSPNSYTVNPGDLERTGQNFTVNFDGDDDRTSYTVRVAVQVTDADGNVSEAEIDYTVSDDVTDIKNDRYPAQAVTNVSGTSAFEVAPSSASFMTASIVNSEGAPASPNETGFIQLTTNSGQNYGIAIDELTSTEVGTATASSSDVTGYSFSHYFGLNNLFSSDGTDVTDAAINMGVRSDIAADPNKIALGQLALSETSTTDTVFTYELAIGNASAIRNLAAMDELNTSFAAADSLPQSTTTFSRYSADIISFVATEAARIDNTQTLEDLTFSGLLETFQEQSGVDVDEELAGIVELEANFRASAQLISIIDELFGVLTSMVRG